MSDKEKKTLLDFLLNKLGGIANGATKNSWVRGDDKDDDNDGGIEYKINDDARPKPNGRPAPVYVPKKR